MFENGIYRMARTADPHDLVFRKGIALRPMTASSADCLRVTRWRNTDIARRFFFDSSVVTPDSHTLFMANRKPHDLVFVIVANSIDQVGMCSLTVDTITGHGEYGRLVIDENHNGHGYGWQAEVTLLSYAFDLLHLNRVWCDILAVNRDVIAMHERTGFVILGTDLSGHTHSKGSVVTMEVWAKDWPAIRARYEA